MKMLKNISIISMMLTVFAFAEIPLLKTGQTTVYTEYDDGYYQAGKARSYSRSRDVVKDNVMGLEWQDNETVTKTWSDAIIYCSDLPLDGGGWRLPSIEELETLVDEGQYNPSTTEGVFQHIVSHYYWSSLAGGYNNDSAWYVLFSNGYSNKHLKSYTFYVRCVRGEPMESTHTFSRNYITEIVSDETTGLQWQDDVIVASTDRNWTEAIDYCENTLTLGDHNDWRLPNRKELLSIVDRSRYNPAINDTVFANTATRNYSSSTTYVQGTDRAWSVSFSVGYSHYDYSKTDSYYVRCVRSEQDEHQPSPIPTNIIASDGTLENMVAVSWSEVANADHYNVYRSVSQDETGYLVGVVTSTSFSDDTVEEDTKYYYRVTACNDDGCSDYSVAESGYIGTFGPAIPTNIIASDGTLENMVAVSWNEITNAN